MSQESTGNCSERSVQINFVVLHGFEGPAYPCDSFLVGPLNGPRKRHSQKEDQFGRPNFLQNYFRRPMLGSSVWNLCLAITEKSTLWTNAGVDQNFQRDLGAIGPYELPEIHMDEWPLRLISREIHVDQWLCKFVNSFSWDSHWSMDGSSQNAQLILGGVYICVCIYIYIYAGELLVCPLCGHFEGC